MAKKKTRCSRKDFYACVASKLCKCGCKTKEEVAKAKKLKGNTRCSKNDCKDCKKSEVYDCSCKKKRCKKKS